MADELRDTLDVRCVPSLCENYLRKMKVEISLHILAENDMKVGNRAQYITLY